MYFEAESDLLCLIVCGCCIISGRLRVMRAEAGRRGAGDAVGWRWRRADSASLEALLNLESVVVMWWRQGA